MTGPAHGAPKIAVLHGSQPSVTIRDLVRAAHHSCELLFVLDPDGGVSTTEARLLEGFGTLITSEPAAWPELVRRADVQGVTTFDDRYVDAQEEVAAASGLPGVSHLPNAWDKYVQRQALNAAGASSVRARLVHSGAGLTELLAEVGFPAILKPLRGSTSRGIRIFESPQTLGRGEHSPPGEAAVLEQLMDTDDAAARPGYAPFLSVETASDDTRRVHFAVTDKLELVDGYLETGDIAPSSLPADIVQQVVVTVDRALDALGVSARMTHTEVRLTSSGPQVIEVNGRLGGFVQGLVQRSTNVDAAALALRVAAGGSVADVSPYDGNHSAAASAVVLVPLREASDQQARALLEHVRDDPDVAAVELPAPVDDAFRSLGIWTPTGSHAAVAEMVRNLVAHVARSPLADVVDTAWLSSYCPRH